MNDDEFQVSSEGTVIAFEYGELAARVIVGQNLSPDYIQTILRDAQREVVSAARKLGMDYQAIEADVEASADEG